MEGQLQEEQPETGRYSSKKGDSKGMDGVMALRLQHSAQGSGACGLCRLALSD